MNTQHENVLQEFIKFCQQQKLESAMIAFQKEGSLTIGGYDLNEKTELLVVVCAATVQTSFGNLKESGEILFKNEKEN